LKEGDFDHFTVDLDGHRLFLTAEANGLVEVFDTRTNKLIHTIRGIEAPHSMLYRDDLKRLCVVDGDASEIKETGEKLFFTPDLPLIAFVSC